MSALQASRRGFLGNLAILTAGVALGSNAAGLFTDNSFVSDLKRHWEDFCRRRSAKAYPGMLKAKKEIVACQGHQPREGQLVYFPEDNIVAEPIWIYWAANKNKPSDVIINLYKEGVAMGTLNQFEMKALCETKELSNCLAAFFQVNNDGARLYSAQTTIGTHNHITTQFKVLKSASMLV
ncbi:twin-arginine translocation signal domain-containing protein [Niabella yanshanensis]|uniref:Twin-arginine translocation signal domain-containing protein n=1 Tax=Niabella yanshanensis TaxID=577386 RepID=A0ABZ0W0M3_9BACT|nr:twin-arginine translocation signal domain-containing protein [Niabella yanshanensis]WQD36474.1 twin-arginine translocation signal domain-containing protein [Niabella yanshanensis]